MPTRPISYEKPQRPADAHGRVSSYRQLVSLNKECALSLPVSRREGGGGVTSVRNNWAMTATLARKVLASRLKREGLPDAHIRHLARGTSIEVLRQRSDDSRVEIKLLSDSDPHTYLVPADAIDAKTAKLMSIHRPPRHRRSSGLSLVPVDWKPPRAYIHPPHRSPTV